MVAPVQQLLSFLFLLCPVAETFPAGPGWEWIPTMVDMAGKEFGEVADPLVKMSRNGELYPWITPIERWELSSRLEPLWQAEGQGVLALLYEEAEVEAQAQPPRAVIAFRGADAEGNPIDTCALEVLRDDPDEVNTTLRAWCNATYEPSTFDYYGQAVAYTMRVLEWCPPSSVLLSGASMGGMVMDLAAAGLWTEYSIDLPVLAFLNPGRRRTMEELGISLEGHSTAMMGAGNRWDPLVMLDWENRIGTMCLFTTEEPPICSACFAGKSSISQVPSAMSEACTRCKSLTHDSRLLVRLMLEGLNPTCYLMDDRSSSATKQR